MSFDGFVLLPLPTFEISTPRKTTRLVKMPNALLVASGMDRATRRCASRTTAASEEPDYSVETADASSNSGRIHQDPVLVIPASSRSASCWWNRIMNTCDSVTERTPRSSCAKPSRQVRRHPKQFLWKRSCWRPWRALRRRRGWGCLAGEPRVSVAPRVSLWSVMLALSLGAGVACCSASIPRRARRS